MYTRRHMTCLGDGRQARHVPSAGGGGGVETMAGAADADGDADEPALSQLVAPAHGCHHTHHGALVPRGCAQDHHHHPSSSSHPISRATMVTASTSASAGDADDDNERDDGSDGESTDSSSVTSSSAYSGSSSLYDSALSEDDSEGSWSDSGGWTTELYGSATTASVSSASYYYHGTERTASRGGRRPRDGRARLGRMRGIRRDSAEEDDSATAGFEEDVQSVDDDDDDDYSSGSESTSFSEHVAFRRRSPRPLERHAARRPPPRRRQGGPPRLHATVPGKEPDVHSRSRASTVRCRAGPTTRRGPQLFGRLPYELFLVVCQYLPVTDYLTLLGVSRDYFQAITCADVLLWRDACLDRWRHKQGFRRFVEDFCRLDAAAKREELEMMALQQRMIRHEFVCEETNSDPVTSRTVGRYGQSSSACQASAAADEAEDRETMAVVMEEEDEEEEGVVAPVLDGLDGAAAGGILPTPRLLLAGLGGCPAHHLLGSQTDHNLHGREGKVRPIKGAGDGGEQGVGAVVVGPPRRVRLQEMPDASRRARHGSLSGSHSSSSSHHHQDGSRRRTSETTEDAAGSLGEDRDGDGDGDGGGGGDPRGRHHLHGTRTALFPRFLRHVDSLATEEQQAVVGDRQCAARETAHGSAGKGVAARVIPPHKRSLLARRGVVDVDDDDDGYHEDDDATDVAQYGDSDGSEVADDEQSWACGRRTHRHRHRHRRRGRDNTTNSLTNQDTRHAVEGDTKKNSHVSKTARSTSPPHAHHSHSHHRHHRQPRNRESSDAREDDQHNEEEDGHAEERDEEDVEQLLRALLDPAHHALHEHHPHVSRKKRGRRQHRRRSRRPKPRKHTNKRKHPHQHAKASRTRTHSRSQHKRREPEHLVHAADGEAADGGGTHVVARSNQKRSKKKKSRRQNPHVHNPKMSKSARRRRRHHQSRLARHEAARPEKKVNTDADRDDGGAVPRAPATTSASGTRTRSRSRTSTSSDASQERLGGTHTSRTVLYDRHGDTTEDAALATLSPTATYQAIKSAVPMMGARQLAPLPLSSLAANAKSVTSAVDVATSVRRTGLRESGRMAGQPEATSVSPALHAASTGPPPLPPPLPAAAALLPPSLVSTLPTSSPALVHVPACPHAHHTRTGRADAVSPGAAHAQAHSTRADRLEANLGEDSAPLSWATAPDLAATADSSSTTTGTAAACVPPPPPSSSSSSRLYWWQMNPDERHRQLRRLQRHQAEEEAAQQPNRLGRGWRGRGRGAAIAASAAPARGRCPCGAALAFGEDAAVVVVGAGGGEGSAMPPRLSQRPHSPTSRASTTPSPHMMPSASPHPSTVVRAGPGSASRGRPSVVGGLDSTSGHGGGTSSPTPRLLQPQPPFMRAGARTHAEEEELAQWDAFDEALFRQRERVNAVDERRQTQQQQQQQQQPQQPHPSGSAVLATANMRGQCASFSPPAEHHRKGTSSDNVEGFAAVGTRARPEAEAGEVLGGDDNDDGEDDDWRHEDDDDENRSSSSSSHARNTPAWGSEAAAHASEDEAEVDPVGAVASPTTRRVRFLHTAGADAHTHTPLSPTTPLTSAAIEHLQRALAQDEHTVALADGCPLRGVAAHQAGQRSLPADVDEAATPAAVVASASGRVMGKAEKGHGRSNSSSTSSSRQPTASQPVVRGRESTQKPFQTQSQWQPPPHQHQHQHQQTRQHAGRQPLSPPRSLSRVAAQLPPRRPGEDASPSHVPHPRYKKDSHKRLTRRPVTVPNPYRELEEAMRITRAKSQLIYALQRSCAVPSMGATGAPALSSAVVGRAVDSIAGQTGPVPPPPPPPLLTPLRLPRDTSSLSLTALASPVSAATTPAMYTASAVALAATSDTDMAAQGVPGASSVGRPVSAEHPSYGLATRSSLSGGGGGEDVEDLLEPVSWKFAYHMSLREAHRVLVTVQDLVEGTWYACFRATGQVHPVVFAVDKTLRVLPPLALDHLRTSGVQTRTVSPTSAATTTTTADAPAPPSSSHPPPRPMPPLTYHLLQGGAQLIVHSFPVLQIRRRLTQVTASTSRPRGAAAGVGGGGGGSTGAAPLADAVAAAAFAAEPQRTLQRLSQRTTTPTTTTHQDSISGEGSGGTPTSSTSTTGSTSVGQDGYDPDDDWGWTMRNAFVVIFSADVQAPFYVRHLHRLVGSGDARVVV